MNKYNINIFYRHFIVLLLGMTLLTACKEDDDVMRVPEPTEDLALVASKQPSLDLFRQALRAAGLENILTGSNQITIFAPTNGAMQALLRDLGVETVNDIPQQDLATLLSYHVVNGALTSSLLTPGQYPTLLTGSSIGVSVTSSVILNGTSRVTTANLTATNGVIHVIDQVLAEIPTNTIGNVVDAFAAAPTGAQFTLLKRALDRAGLTNTLNTTDGLTVFAPTDAAFNAAGLNASAIDGATVEALQAILLYHVIAGYNYSVQFSNGRVFTLLGESGTAKGLDVRVNNAAVSLNNSILNPNGSQVIIPNVLSTNGVIHVVNQVLTPKNYVWERLLSSNYRYQEFREALLNGNNDDLVDLLSTEERYAILAPTPAGLVPIQSAAISEAEKRAILERHIFRLSDNNNFTTIGSIPSGSKITSIDGSTYFVTQNRRGTYFNGRLTTLTFNGGPDANHRNTDVYNGTVTALGPNVNNSGVYLNGNFGLLTTLPATTVSNVLDGQASISLFAASVAKLELLQNNVNYTIFAVEDDAFSTEISDLGLNSVAAIQALDPEDEEDAGTLTQLAEIVNQYIFRGVEFAVDISADLPILTTVGGADLAFVNNGGFLEILNISANSVQNNIGIVSVDLIANNGVVHIIDATLFEQ